MKYFFYTIVLLHGLIHIMGFVKGFGLKEVKELTLPISKQMGLLWLASSLLILFYVVTMVINLNYAWLFGFIAAFFSQTLIFTYWKDAKFGTIINVTIFIASIISYGNFHFQQIIQKETTNLLNQVSISNQKILSEQDVKHLPSHVKRWIYRSGAIGKPFISLGKITQEARMKMKPKQKNWLTAEAKQYTTIDSPGFIWTVQVRINSLINFQGRDKFQSGRGEMLIKLNSLFNIVNEKGEKLNEGTLQRYLGEMVWFPSLALSPYIDWKEVDNDTAVATMDYMGTRGSGTFYYNSDGDFVKFSSMRFRATNQMPKDTNGCCWLRITIHLKE